MHPQERKIARIAGQVRYSTGRPCVNGHVAERYAESGLCSECVVASRRAWRERNRERERASNAARKAANPEQNRKHARDYGRRYPERIRERCSARRAIARGATPKWINRKEIAYFYAQCPTGFHVDHIIPLRGEYVCGLHVPWNLQYLTPRKNIQKSNKLGWI